MERQAARSDLTTAWNYSYDRGQDHPELIEFCQRCTAADCQGICDAWKAKYREVWHVQTGKRESGRHWVHQEYTAFGETHTLNEWVEKTGIGYATLYSRFNSPSWTVEEALTTPIGPRKLITIDGETHTATEWMGITGMPRGSYYKRIREGWSVRDALFTPPPGHKKRREKDD